MSAKNITYFEAIEWTQAFLDYPPVFLGVIGMLGTNEQVLRLQPSHNSKWTEAAADLVRSGFTPKLYLAVMSQLNLRNEREKLSAEQIHRVFVVESRRAKDGLPSRLKPSVMKIIPRADRCGLRMSVIIDKILTGGVQSLRNKVRLLERERDDFLESFYLMQNFVLVESLHRKRPRKQDNLET